MIINSNNIQKWMFDYFEGELTQAEHVAFEQFILEHPEYHGEFLAWKESTNAFQEEDNTPEYKGAAALLMTVPFYATQWFKVAASVVVVSSVLLGGLSYISNQNIEAPSYEAYDYENSLSEKFYFDMALLKQVDNFELSSSNLDESNLPGSGLNAPDYNGSPFINNGTNLSGNNQNLNNLSWVNANGIDNISIDNLNLSIGALINLNTHPLEVKKLLNLQLSKKKKNSVQKLKKKKPLKYQFLNFKSHSVKGIENKRSKNKTNYKPSKKPHREGKNKNRKHSVWQKISRNLQNSELGLTNINDPIFAISGHHTLQMNNALVGQLPYTRVKSNFRLIDINGNRTFSLTNSADSYIKPLKAGIGFQNTRIWNDQVKYQDFRFTYSQKVELNRESSLSLAGTVAWETLDNQSVFGPEQEWITGNTFRPYNTGKTTQLNAGFAAWYAGKNFFGGLNVTNLLSPSLYGTHESQNWMEQLDLNVQIGTDYKRGLTANTIWSPYVTYRDFNGYKEAWTGLVVRHKSLVAGVSASQNLNAKAIIGIQNHNLRFIYGYDNSYSELHNNRIGNHELSVRLLFGVRNENLLRYEI